MDFLFPPGPQPSVATSEGGPRFPVRRIYCVGRNFADHAREMGHDPNREPPFFFSKPADSLLTDGGDLPYPPQTQDLHYEGELVVALHKGGRDISAAQALSHVWGYGAGNDFTRRDMQSEAKKLARPWDLSKGFDNGAACGILYPARLIGHPAKGRITSSVNGELRQDGDLSQMIWSVPEIIAFLSQSVALAAGDLIFTGTPAGVGGVCAGDVVTVTIDGISPLVTKIV